MAPTPATNDGPSFDELPESARREILAHRERETRAAARVRERHCRQRARTVLEASVLFVFFESLLTYFELGRSLAALPTGILLGLVWHHFAAGRFFTLLSGVGFHIGFRAVFGFGDAFTGLFGVLAFACVATALGTSQETRRRDG